MKYIVMSVEDKDGAMEIPFLFPELVVHADMAEWTGRLLRQQFRGCHVKPISGGFLSSMVDADCHGKSESLNLRSRGKVDSTLINMSDYGSIHV